MTGYIITCLVILSTRQDSQVQAYLDVAPSIVLLREVVAATADLFEGTSHGFPYCTPLPPASPLICSA